VTQVSDLGGATPRRDTGRLAVGRDYTVKRLRQKKYAGTPRRVAHPFGFKGAAFALLWLSQLASIRTNPCSPLA
jgi:hypothetical protein